MKSLSEAKKLAKEGDEALKTGLFKWNKDYATAAISYEEAAKLYRLAKDHDNALKIYEKCAACNEKMNDSWGVARNYENIVTMSIERTDGKVSIDALCGYTKKAGMYFRMANSIQTYINLVKKVSAYLEEKNTTVEAANLYKELLNDLEEDDKHLKSEVVTQYATLLVKEKKFDECITLFEREFVSRKEIQAKSGNRQNLDTLALTIISLYIVIGDIEKGERKLGDFAMEVRDFLKTPEYDVSEKMLEAYRDGKQEDFDKVTQRSVLNNIFPMNIIKEIRKVKVKALPPKKKSMHLDDIVKHDDFSNASTNQGFGNEKYQYEAPKQQEKEEPVIDEEKRKAEADDFIN